MYVNMIYFLTTVMSGVDHNAEAVTGFFTMFGDGACDLTVLNGLNKRQIRLMAKAMGASETLWNKAPTADLEELNPGKLDDDGYLAVLDALPKLYLALLERLLPQPLRHAAAAG